MQVVGAKTGTDIKHEWRCQWMKQHLSGRRPVPCHHCKTVVMIEMRVPFDALSVQGVTDFNGIPIQVSA